MFFLSIKCRVRTINTHLAHHCASTARSDGSNTPDAQMLPLGVPDLNDKDSSDDDIYGPYPPYDTRSPAESDHPDGKIVGLFLFDLVQY
jgi:hypothetical protein